jgi:hypothetical protein
MEAVRALCAPVPRPLLAQSLDQFDAQPERPLLDAAAGDAETVIYTLVGGPDGSIRAAAVAAIVPWGRYLDMVWATAPKPEG